MSTTKDVAEAIKVMSYSELIELASDLVAMQKGAKDDGWEWIPTQIHGEFGLAQMLYSWAESQE